VSARLLPFLPIPMVGKEDEKRYRWLIREGPAAVDRPAVGVHGQCGRAAACLHLHAHARARRHDRVGEYATLNANYLLARLKHRTASTPPIRSRRASHEFIITLKRRRANSR
jgi:glycine dehydrogenase subunit 2